MLDPIYHGFNSYYIPTDGEQLNHLIIPASLETKTEFSNKSLLRLRSIIQWQKLWVKWVTDNELDIMKNCIRQLAVTHFDRTSICIKLLQPAKCYALKNRFKTNIDFLVFHH